MDCKGCLGSWPTLLWHPLVSTDIDSACRERSGERINGVVDYLLCVKGDA
jgi:hypothetical protein